MKNQKAWISELMAYCIIYCLFYIMLLDSLGNPDSS